MGEFARSGRAFSIRCHVVQAPGDDVLSVWVDRTAITPGSRGGRAAEGRVRQKEQPIPESPHSPLIISSEQGLIAKHWD